MKFIVPYDPFVKEKGTRNIKVMADILVTH
jgi:hypothetical protein